MPPVGSLTPPPTLPPCSSRHSAERRCRPPRNRARALVCWALAAALLSAVPAGLPAGTAAAQSTVDCATAGGDGSYEVPHDWALKPSGLSDGGTFRLLFITSNATNASSTGIAAYNTFVQNTVKTGHTAISDACGNLFKAVASTSAVDARANTDTESTDTAASIWWLGGAKAADNYADFYDGGWDDYGSRSETGTARSVSWVYTGSNTDGTKHASQHMGATNARVGTLTTGQNPLNAAFVAATNSLSLYGLSPLFKAAANPCTTEVPPSWALTPAGLSDGDKFRLLFMSSTQRDGSSTDIADYNTHVQTAAKAGHTAISDSCGNQFKAVASTSTVDARANTDTESSDTAASIWWLGGAKAADDYADFYDGGWDSYAKRNESGASTSIDFVWTGSNADGTKHASEYLGSAASARFGQPESGHNPINQNRNPAATNNYPLYGLSPVFTVTTAPCATADTTDGSYEVPYDWALKPGGLTDGNTFRLLFVSSTQRDGSSTEIADYNTHVQTAAKAGHAAISDGCGDLFKAVASTSTVDARANTDTESTDTDASVWWLGGGKAADDYADFWDGTWDSYGRRTQAGAGGASNLVYTGSDDDGTKHNTDFLGSSTGWRIGDINTGQNPISQSSDGTGGTGTRSLLGMSPLFKVEQRPTVSFLSSALSSGENSSPAFNVILSEVNSSGADLEFPVRIKNTGTTASPSEYSLSDADCEEAGGGSSTVTISDGNLAHIGRIWLCDDDVDEPDETVTLEFGTLPDGWVAGAHSELVVTITDDDATVVSAVASSDVELTEQDTSDTASFTVSLGRRLRAGENLHVPLEWVPATGSIGVAMPSDADPVFSVAVSGTGVAGEDLGEDEFGVRFTGSDIDVVREATVTLTPTGNGDDDGDDESFRAEVFEAGADWANAFTTVSGGGAPHADDNEVSFTFVDDDRVPGAGIVLDHAALGVVAGGMVSSRVSLAVEPFGPVTVALSQSQISAGVASPSVSSLAFDRSNWDVPQVVRVDGHAQGSSLVSYTASGGGYEGVTVDQGVIVAGVPAAPSGCWKCVWASAGNSAGQPSSTGYRVGPTPEGEAVWFTVHVDQAASVDVEARLWVVDAKGWASFFLPGRYAARTLGVWIPAGRTSVTFSVPTVDDSHHEPGGSVSARIINAQNCSYSRCSPYVGYNGAGPEPSVQVADNDPAPPPYVPPRVQVSTRHGSAVQSRQVSAGDYAYFCWGVYAGTPPSVIIKAIYSIESTSGRPVRWLNGRAVDSSRGAIQLSDRTHKLCITVATRDEAGHTITARLFPVRVGLHHRRRHQHRDHHRLAAPHGPQHPTARTARTGPHHRHSRPAHTRPRPDRKSRSARRANPARHSPRQPVEPRAASPRRTRRNRGDRRADDR